MAHPFCYESDGTAESLSLGTSVPKPVRLVPQRRQPLEPQARSFSVLCAANTAAPIVRAADDLVRTVRHRRLKATLPHGSTAFSAMRRRVQQGDTLPLNQGPVLMLPPAGAVVIAQIASARRDAQSPSQGVIDARTMHVGPDMPALAPIGGKQVAGYGVMPKFGKERIRTHDAAFLTGYQYSSC